MVSRGFIIATKVIGHWSAICKSIAAKEFAIQNKSMESMYVVSSQIKKHWKEGIRKNALGLEPNKKTTLMSKRSSSPLRMSGEMVKEIKSVPLYHGSTLLHYIGILQKPGNAVGRFNNAKKALFHNMSNRGDIIIKSKDKLLAVPVSIKARKYNSPREFSSKLEFIPRIPKDANLIGYLRAKKGFAGAKHGGIHYFLKKRVVIPQRPHIESIYEFAQLIHLKTMKMFLARVP